MSNTPKPHLIFKTHTKLCFIPKLNPHTRNSTYIQETHNSHKRLQRARPTGLANIKNQKHKRKRREKKKKKKKKITKQNHNKKSKTQTTLQD